MNCAGAGPRVYVNIHIPPWEAYSVRRALSERLYHLESPSHHAACGLALLPPSEFPTPSGMVDKENRLPQCPMSPFFPMKRLENENLHFPGSLAAQVL